MVTIWAASWENQLFVYAKNKDADIDKDADAVADKDV